MDGWLDGLSGNMQMQTAPKDIPDFCKPMILFHRSALSSLDSPIVLFVGQSNKCCKHILFMLAHRSYFLKSIMITNKKIKGLGSDKLKELHQINDQQ